MFESILENFAGGGAESMDVDDKPGEDEDYSEVK